MRSLKKNPFFNSWVSVSLSPVVYLDGYIEFLRVELRPLPKVGVSPILDTTPRGPALGREQAWPGGASSEPCHPTAAGSPHGPNAPSEAGVDQLPGLLEHLLPSVYGIKNFLPGPQVHLDALKVLIRAKHQGF